MANIQASELTAQRWSKALMELVLEDEKVSGDVILSNLNDVADTIDASAELREVIHNPSISVNEKNEVMSRIFQDKILPLVFNFLFVLNLKKRLDIIRESAIEFQKELEKQRNILHVDITSAIELDDNKKDEIKCKIADKLQKDIIINWNVNSDIIAGLVFNIDNTVVNNSVKYKLDNLKKDIMKV